MAHGPLEEYHYPCDQCGADLRFAPGQTRLVCDHCGHEQAIPAAVGRGTALGLHELDLRAGLRNALMDDAVEDLRSISCPNCGAVIELSEEAHAGECPFCATPVVIDTGARRQIKPQGLVPFSITEEEARDSLGRWLRSLWFAPNGLKVYARKGRRMNGIYSPFWTFDADTRSRYRGQRGTYYYETRTVTVTVNGKRQHRQEQVRKIRWTPVSGRVARHFDDVLVLAATSLPRSFTDALKPWDLSALVPYQPDYLAGFRAEGYTVDLDDGHRIGREEMARVIEMDVRRDIGGDAQRVEAVDTDFSAETFKHILLPVWTAAYKYGGKSYRFVVNGQTGKVRGERPWSWIKIAFAVLLAAIVAGIIFGLSQNQ
ncbi:primosomal protein N' (replication factor Y) - superfamily II helicase [Ostreiculturibacter nitratireducens]|uniref:primosomal protein N' (replication factor Y) - superfamily II helicase n=1 Tax=Ostreiculturibacter nitratireducens TaxID=3075226 RepID=UPI0031B593CA